MNREGFARYPSLYEINTRVWLCRLSQEAGKPVTLADIDDATLYDRRSALSRALYAGAKVLFCSAMTLGS
jgi:hypothetical protein